MAYRIVELKESEKGGFAPRGQAVEFWRSKDPETILSGPAETGKTWTCCQKLNALAWKYPNAQLAMIRKTQSSLQGSVVPTFRRVLGQDSPVTAYGGETPVWFDYPNGSRIWLAGMDNPNKILSSERDFIYVNQAEELSVEDWETLRTRNTGRGGVAPYAQQFADCNPGAPSHWIKQRQKDRTLRLFESRHEDNPTLYDENGVITEQGIKSLAVLDGLTGVRYSRLRKGLWVAAEGVVYENYDPLIHLRPRSEVRIDPSWPHVWDFDFGFDNPFVWHDWVIDPDGRMILNREIYRTKRLVEEHARDILELTKGDTRPRWIVADHDAEGRATLEKYLKMQVRPAYKSVEDGIQACMQRLQVGRDRRPRVILLNDALVSVDKELREKGRPTCTADEFEVYIWDTGKGTILKDRPIKENDHGMDGWRYQVAELDHLHPHGKKPGYDPLGFMGSARR
jgi:PBSX family phage terminase large subunit